MAVAWTDITNAQVAAGAPVTTALMTALRDNPEGIAQRASGAPKIFGVPYDYQEFTASGTWTKPSNAETGDKVIVHCIGGGGGGGRDVNFPSGGTGGGNAATIFEDIDNLPATMAIVVGAGGAGRTGTDGAGTAGGDSTVAAASATFYELEGPGGEAGLDGGAKAAPSTPIVGKVGAEGRDTQAEVVFGSYVSGNTVPSDCIFTGGFGGEGPIPTTALQSLSQPGRGRASIFGGGGGGQSRDIQVGEAGMSYYAGNGGYAGTGDGGGANAESQAGFFPGGGGGSGENGVDASDGADGVVRVWCYKEG